MSKLFSISFVSLLMLLAAPAYADDWCQKSNGSIAPCVNTTPPNGWVQCGVFNGESIWCHPSASAKENGGDDAAGGGGAKKSRRFYAGLSVGYAAYVSGGMKADYADEPDAWKAPGSFKRSAFEIETRSTPVQISLGANIIGGLRADISYMQYSGISMPDLVRTATGGRSGYDGYFSFHATGGDVSGSATMLNAYYDFGRLTGRFIGGKLSPYIGAGIGLGANEISDYEIFDSGMYSLDAGITGASNIRALHFGGTAKNNLVYMFEAGGTAELLDRLQLDLFVRWTALGRVQTKGNIILTQTVWQGGSPVYDETLRFDWRESGTLGFLDIGARLRLLF
ncbi:MAG: hypothetical protein LBL21_00660 [Rickettsiales bacterium]|jgi:hypothetical protein|nr:hypothetical protein [Rickettsiales bacterium]